MRKLFMLSLGVIVLSGCSMNLQASVVFEETWEDLVTEFRWGRRAAVDQEEMKEVFSQWASVYEKKKAKLVRINEEEELEGSTVILGQNIANNIEEMEKALKNLKEVNQVQERNKNLLKLVCASQKTRVDCGL